MNKKNKRIIGIIIFNSVLQTLFYIINNDKLRLVDETKFWPFSGFRHCDEHSWGYKQSSCTVDLLLGYGADELLVYSLLLPLLIFASNLILRK